ncbi:hypothetical protein L1N85_16520 [Paenibacillus alkaliterrae]|nr:hypothetical protein [Paenibacillus alkaliterrae]MCF2940014.1 hypothetical protein [Paenibacillus alkaliterrae]
MQHIHLPRAEVMLSAEPLIHETSTVYNSRICEWTSIGAFNKITMSGE